MVLAALRAAMIPTVNGMMTVGLVQLPGMMTGQILAGSSPLLAIRYQMVVVFMLAAGTGVHSHSSWEGPVPPLNDGAAHAGT